jgi:hypothetical protein
MYSLKNHQISSPGKQFGSYAWGNDKSISTFWKKLPLVLSSWHHLKCTFSMPFMPSACFYNFTWKTKEKRER